MNVKLELEKAFKDYSYKDSNHSYTYIPTGKKLKSVTQFLSSLTPAFDVLFWSTLKAFEYSGYVIKKKNQKEGWFILDTGETINVKDELNINLENARNDIKKKWDIDKKIGLARGTYLHKLLESKELKEKEPNVYDFIDKEIEEVIKEEQKLSNIPWDEEYITTKNSFEILYDLAVKFLKEQKYLTPIAIESVVADYRIGLAGTYDRLYYNELTEQFEIWDFKTDKKIDYSNKYESFSLFDLPSCQFEKYSLQTSLYKYIIQTNTPIILGDSNIVHFNHNLSYYQIIKTNDYTNLINEKVNGNNWTTHL